MWAFGISWEASGEGGMGGSGSSEYEKVVFCKTRACVEDIETYERKGFSSYGVQCKWMKVWLLDEDVSSLYVVQKHESWCSDMASTRDALLLSGRSLATFDGPFMDKEEKNLDGDSEMWVAVYRSVPMQRRVPFIDEDAALVAEADDGAGEGFLIPDSRFLVGVVEGGGKRIALPSEMRRCAHNDALPTLRTWLLVCKRLQWSSKDVALKIAQEILWLYYGDIAKVWQPGRPRLRYEYADGIEWFDDDGERRLHLCREPPTLMGIKECSCQEQKDDDYDDDDDDDNGDE